MQHGRRQQIGLLMVMTTLAAGLACSQPPSNPALPNMDVSSRQTRMPGEYLVTLAAGADSKIIADVYGRFGIKGIRDLGHNTFLVTFAVDPGPERIESVRGRNAQITAVQPNFVYRHYERGSVQ